VKELYGNVLAPSLFRSSHSDGGHSNNNDNNFVLYADT